MAARQGLFSRLVLPGLAFKAAVIGGGYATGRELTSFFLPYGARGGLEGMVLVIAVWAVICALTFVFAFQTGSQDYRSFFRHLLGRGWWLYEIGWMAALLVILAVFAAASGELFLAMFGWPRLVGELLLMIAMAACATGGGRWVEALFKWASVILYATFATLIVLVALRFGGRIGQAFSLPVASRSWPIGGLTYAGYNILGAIVVLPVTRHLTSRRDAVIAGLLAAPLAMIPAILFFVAITAFSPEIAGAALPSDHILLQLGMPWFRWLFQAMIFCALLESGVSGLHAINERAAHGYADRTGTPFPARLRLLLAAVVLILAVFVANRFGLIALVAEGYRWLSYFFLAVFVVPLLTYGSYRIVTDPRRQPA